MSHHDEITADANQRVAAWRTEDRAALLERLTAKPVVKPLNDGFSVDIGEAYPVWCADKTALNELLDRRALLAAELHDGA